MVAMSRQFPPPEGPVIDAQATLLSQISGDNSELAASISALPNKYRKYLTSYGRVDPHE